MQNISNRNNSKENHNKQKDIYDHVVNEKVKQLIEEKGKYDFKAKPSSDKLESRPITIL